MLAKLNVLQDVKKVLLQIKLLYLLFLQKDFKTLKETYKN